MDATFDLIAHPERISPPFGFYAIFWIVGAIFAIISVTAAKLGVKRLYRLAIFTLIWIAFVSVMTFLDARDLQAVRKLVQASAYQTVEGCLEFFHPGKPYGSRSAAGNERWRVAGQSFDYGEGEVRPGYHMVEAQGGLVHSTSKVTASFVKSPFYGRNEIVRLQITNNACPPAPDNSGY